MKHRYIYLIARIEIQVKRWLRNSLIHLVRKIILHSHTLNMDQAVFFQEHNITAKNHNSAGNPSHEWMTVQEM